MRKEKKNMKKWFYWFSLALLLIIVYKVLDSFTAIGTWFGKLFSVLTPFIVGAIIAYVLYVPSKKLENLISKNKFLRKRSRGISVLIVYAILITILVVSIRFIIPPLISSFQDLASNLQNYYVGLKSKIEALPADSFFKSDTFMEALNKLTDFKIEDFVSFEKITMYAQGVISVASGIFDVFVAIIVSVYLLLERTRIVGFFKRLVESSFNRNVYVNVRKYFNKSNEIFCNFLAGQLFDAVVVGVLTSIAMSIMHVKYAIILGLFIGLFNLIPYFGAIVAVAISVFITLITGGLAQAVEMGIVIIILQQIDANIINPKIVGDSVKISPLLVIFSVTIGGAFFGVMGMFLAVPVAAVIKLILEDMIIYNYSKKQKKDNVEELLVEEDTKIDKSE